MPFASIRKKRVYDRELYKEKYSSDAKFAEAERERQRKIYEANREKIIARVMARRAALKEAKLAAAAKPVKAKISAVERQKVEANREKIIARAADRRTVVKAAKLAAAKAAAAKSTKALKAAKVGR